MSAQEDLGARLRELRQTWSDVSVSQRHLSQALGVSGALISSWENGQAVPPEDRLNAYARFFSSRRSMQPKMPALIPTEDLTGDEEEARQSLIDELISLRDAALDDAQPRQRERGALGGRFWYMPDDQPITILCTPLSAKQLGYSAAAGESGALPPAVQYSTNPSHPNFVRNIANGDVDALLELVGHIRAENPTTLVRWLTYDRLTSSDQLSGHLVILGGGDFADTSELPAARDALNIFGEFKKLLGIPVEAKFDEPGEDRDPEFDGRFVVTVDAQGDPDTNGTRTEVYRPRFIRDENVEGRPRSIARGAPQSEADLALIVRKPNPLNAAAKVSMFSGMFSRGTYGAVRAFTDVRYRARNEKWVHEMNPDDFWTLVRVPVFGGQQTITPDLSRASTRLATSG